MQLYMPLLLKPLCSKTFYRGLLAARPREFEDTRYWIYVSVHADMTFSKCHTAKSLLKRF